MIQVLKIVVTGRFESAVLLGQFALRVALNCKNVSLLLGGGVIVRVQVAALRGL